MLQAHELKHARVTFKEYKYFIFIKTAVAKERSPLVTQQKL